MNIKVYVVDRLFCLDPLVNVAPVKADSVVIVVTTGVEPITSTPSFKLLNVAKLKVVVGLVVGGLVIKEYVTLIVEPALTADNKLIEIVLLAGVAVHVVATDWCKHVPPPVRPTVDGTVTTTFELEGSALGTCMMKE